MTDENIIDAIAKEFPGSAIEKVQPLKVSISETVAFDLENLKEVQEIMIKYMKSQMREEEDYGYVVKGGKPSLFKPGAEKLQTLWGLSAETRLKEKIEEYNVPVTETTFPVFSYIYTTEIRNKHGYLLATCDGQANSYESKYRWRRGTEGQVGRFNTSLLDYEFGSETEFDFAITKAETTGTYGKPAEYWQKWQEDIADGIAVSTKRKTRAGNELEAWKREGKVYRIPNEDIHSQINTIIKISQKRSYVGAITLATNASNLFTHDLEDFSPRDVEAPSIHTYVPDKDTAARKLIKYTTDLGIENAGDWIKALLEAKNLEWSLENWSRILNEIDDAAISI